MRFLKALPTACLPLTPKFSLLTTVTDFKNLLTHQLNGPQYGNLTSRFKKRQLCWLEKVTFKNDGSTLAIIHEVHGLGVYHLDYLNFKCHIDRIVCRVNSIANFILRAYKTPDISVLFRLFAMYVRPLLSPAWSPYYRTNFELVEGVQKVLRIVVLLASEISKFLVSISFKM